MPRQIKFPKRFMWGASLSAHQADGGSRNQWSKWEQDNAHSLAAQAPYQYGDLDTWDEIETEAKNPQNYISGDASDHRGRRDEDFDLLEKVQLDTLRFSIEWSRIEPTEGGWNSEAMQYYKDYLAELRKRNITPVVTLFHFTLPAWFAEKGGFAKRSNVKYFTRFVEKIAEELGGQLSYVITINEPTVYAAQSYYVGAWPPNVRSKLKTWRVTRNLLRAHREAAKALHQRSRRIKVSMAHHVSYIYAGDDAWLSLASARLMDWMKNRYVIKRSLRSSDFIGVNYYASERVYGYRVHNPNERVSDLGWDLQPSNLSHVLEELDERYHKPIIVTENGLADAADQQRSWWLQETIQALYQAIQKGADVRGYIHWSLIDNFEWDKGRWPRFGLVEVDYTTQKRTVRPSARRLARVLHKLKEDAR